MTLHDSQSNLTGSIEATAEHPDGRELVRISDNWMFKDECEEAKSPVWCLIGNPESTNEDYQAWEKRSGSPARRTIFPDVSSETGSTPETVE